jgi:hypothetical protein
MKGYAMNINTVSEPKILSQTLFGHKSRYALVEFLTRFGTIEWFVKDAEVCDENGYSQVVFQSSSKKQALARFGYKELETVGIVRE